jgi:hypothetical protein
VTGLQFGTWYTTSFSAVGATLTCTISGGNLASPVTVSYTDPSPIPSGSAGLGGYGATGAFDDFVVEAL